MPELILIRHAEAEEPKTTDAARRLTHKGRKQAKVLAKLLAAELTECDLFVHSAITRSEETLKLILGPTQTLNIMSTTTLKHSAPAIEFAKWLKIHGDDLQKILVVGHDPQLSRFVSWAVARSNQTEFEIKKATIVRLQIGEFGLILKKRMKLTELTPIKIIKSARKK